MMSDTGGGHRASAEALKMVFERLYPGKYDITICDIWTNHTPFPWNQASHAPPHAGGEGGTSFLLHCAEAAGPNSFCPASLIP